jgi:hypothetical protein
MVIIIFLVIKVIYTNIKKYSNNILLLSLSPADFKEALDAALLQHEDDRDVGGVWGGGGGGERGGGAFASCVSRGVASAPSA